MKIIDMRLMPDEVMLVLEHSSGVYYDNQVGGVVCARATIEGVLAPIDIHTEAMQVIMNLPYDAGLGIGQEQADVIDSALARSPGSQYLKVDRSRLSESQEAWIFVVAAIPERADVPLYDAYSGAPRGFGLRTGVLTWPNSD